MTKAEIIRTLNNYMSCDKCSAYHVCHSLDIQCEIRLNCVKRMMIER